MNRYGYIGVVGVAALALVPGIGRAQAAVAPASSIRVIEIVDPFSGERDRRVADDLTAAEIARIQQALAAAGFDAGRATGEWNAATRLELGRFQASRGLPQCECVTYATLIELRIRPTVVATVRAPLDGGSGSRTVILLPGRHSHIGHGAGVVVGHGPSVFVGHQPARGAGEFGRTHIGHRRPQVRDRGHGRDGGRHLDSRPPRPRPGSSGLRPGAPLRPLAPPRAQN